MTRRVALWLAVWRLRRRYHKMIREFVNSPGRTGRGLMMIYDAWERELRDLTKKPEKLLDEAPPEP